MFLAQSDEPHIHPGLGGFQENQLDLRPNSQISRDLRFRSGARGTHRAETFFIPSSLCWIFSTLTRDMLINMANRFISQSSVIHYHRHDQLFASLVAVTRCPYIGSCSWRSLPLLNSLAHIYTVDKARVSSTNVATTIIVLGVNYWYNTKETIEWYKKLKRKNELMFNRLWYSSIIEDFLTVTIKIHKNYCDIREINKKRQAPNYML